MPYYNGDTPTQVSGVGSAIAMGNSQPKIKRLVCFVVNS